MIQQDVIVICGCRELHITGAKVIYVDLPETPLIEPATSLPVLANMPAHQSGQQFGAPFLSARNVALDSPNSARRLERISASLNFGILGPKYDFTLLIPRTEN